MKIRPLVPFGLFIFLLGGATYGQAPPPITSSGLNTQVSAPVNLPGGAVQHNITGGTRPGGGANLFHSFGEFGVPTNNIANFLNDSALPTTNILSRVTGGNPSNIFGTIKTEGFSNANLFLMNPAGIVFGPKASLDVRGAAHFTTADYLKLDDGVQFTAMPSAQDALLSVSPIAAFGFLGTNPGGGISVVGSSLSVVEGHTLSLVGGDVTIGGALNARGGQIAIASVAAPGEVVADTYGSAPNINGESFTMMGNIVLSEGATLNVSGDAAGTVIIRGGQLMMANALISADTRNENGASVGIDIDVIGDVFISAFDDSALTARTTGTGNSGEIRLSSGGAINISGGLELGRTRIPIIDTHTSGPGYAGNVSLSSQGDITADGVSGWETYLANTGTDIFSIGKGGDLSITAKNFLSGGMFISTGNWLSTHKEHLEGGSGGMVTISATEKIELSDSGIYTFNHKYVFKGDTTTGFENGGNAGDVTLNAPEISLRNSRIDASGLFQGGHVTINSHSLLLLDSVIRTATGTSPGGGISITGGVVEFVGSQLYSNALRNADAGDISIIATDRVLLLPTEFDLPFDESDPFGFFSVPSALISNAIPTLGEDGIGPPKGTPGNVLLDTPTLGMTGGSHINTLTGTSGNGGDVLIDAQTIFMSGGTRGQNPLPEIGPVVSGTLTPTGIFTRAIALPNCSGFCGNGGDVNIATGSMVLAHGAQINSGPATNGNGGTIRVRASENISISGILNDGTPGGLFSMVTGAGAGAGAGGTISLAAGQNFTISDGATVSASSSGRGNAGNINITAGATILIDKATVTTDAAQASGGKIKLTANERIQLVDSTIESTVKGEANTVAGNIELDPDFIILQNSHILAKAVDGQGGNIKLIASKGVLVDAQSTLEVTSERGISGTVNIESPIQVLSGTIVPLPSTPVNVATLYAARCVAGEGGHFSTFVDSKSDSVAPTPGTFLASPFFPQVSSSPAGALGHAGTPSGVSNKDQIPPIQLAAYSPPVLFAESDGMPSVCP